MELTVPKKDLVKLIARMQGVAERKSTMPVLSNVLLAVDGPSALRIAATDMYLALVGRLTVDVSKGGSAAVSACGWPAIARADSSPGAASCITS